MTLKNIDKNKNKNLIVMYHYIRKKFENKIKLNSLNIEDFKKQINFLEKNGNFINPLDLRNKFFLGKNLLTFDDGYADHFKHVFPVLKKKNIKAIFLLYARVYEKKEFLDVNKIQLIVNNLKKSNLIPTLELIVNKFSKKKIVLSKIIKKNLTRRNKYDAKSVDDFKKLIQFLLPSKISKQSLDEFFYNHLNIDHDKLFKNFYLSIDQILEMHENGMIFGNHTLSHPYLSKLSYKEQSAEIMKNEIFLNKMKLLKKIKCFCYPYGQFNNNTIKIIKRLRYDFAFTVNQGYMNVKQPLLLNRVDTNEIKNFS